MSEKIKYSIEKIAKVKKKPETVKNSLEISDTQVKAKSTDRLKGLIRQALADGLINDEVLAYLKGLGYARYRNPGDGQVEEAIQEILNGMQKIYASSSKAHSKRDLKKYEELAKEKLGEGALKNFNSGESERLIVTLPTEILSYLEKQRILFMPVGIKTSTIAEAGKMLSFRSNGQSRKMYALNKHWVGLYFRSNKEDMQDSNSCNLAQPVTIDNTVFTFVDTNLRNTNIDLFYPGFVQAMNSQRKVKSNSLYLNIAFKNCWVKGMSLQFWRYVANFPGTITITFEDCPDFNESNMPYLAREVGGNRYYFDLEKFMHEVEDFSDEKFEQYMKDIYSLYANFILEHLR